MGEVSKESGLVGAWVPLLQAGSGQGQGHGATAVLVSQADEGHGAQAQLRARKALPRLLAWFPVVNCLAVPGCAYR